MEENMYSVIVIDPPWEVKKIKRESRPNQIEMPYSTMSFEDIKALDIKSISDRNSQLFLWTINKYLPKSFELLDHWGFKYQRCLTWDKQNGMCLFGYHHRSEFVLVGYKGKIEMYPKRKAIPTVFQGKSERHSAKPDEFYNMLSILEGSKIDIFARKERSGWDVWGNEVKSNIELVSRFS